MPPSLGSVFKPSRHTVGQKGTFFSWCSTRDASQATVELRAANPLRKGGISFAQSYNVDKEHLDLMGKYPFAHMSTEAFLVAPHRLELWSRAGSMPYQLTWETCKGIWLASKGRTNDAIRDAEGARVGVRQEYRIRWDLYQRLNKGLEPTRNSARCFWAVKTADVLLFRRWDMNRWLCLLEYLRSRIEPEDLAQEDVVMGTLLRRCLTMSVRNAAIGRDYSLWKSTWTSGKTEISYEGLDLWLPTAKFDWDLLHLRDDLQERTTFLHNAIQESFSRRRRNVQSTSWRNQVIFKAAEQFSDDIIDEPQRAEILDLLRRVCYVELNAAIKDSRHRQKQHRQTQETLDGESWDIYHGNPDDREGWNVKSGNSKHGDSPRITCQLLIRGGPPY